MPCRCSTASQKEVRGSSRPSSAAPSGPLAPGAPPTNLSRPAYLLFRPTCQEIKRPSPPLRAPRAPSLRPVQHQRRQLADTPPLSEMTVTRFGEQAQRQPFCHGPPNPNAGPPIAQVALPAGALCHPAPHQFRSASNPCPAFHPAVGPAPLSIHRALRPPRLSPAAPGCRSDHSIPRRTGIFSRKTSSAGCPHHLTSQGLGVPPTPPARDRTVHPGRVGHAGHSRPIKSAQPTTAPCHPLSLPSLKHQLLAPTLRLPRSLRP